MYNVIATSVGERQCSVLFTKLPFFGRLNALNYLWYYLRNINAKEGQPRIPLRELIVQFRIAG